MPRSRSRHRPLPCATRLATLARMMMAAVLLASTTAPVPVPAAPALGAPVPGPKAPSSDATDAAAAWWAIVPLRPVPVPAAPRAPGHAHGNAATRHPIDAFAGLADGVRKGAPDPANRADRRTLLRRLTVDLHGILPTPEEVAAFESDPAPDAFERQVDRLLASPRYGERWARHWLDVVHFAETHGHDQDRPRDAAWPYRDYVIQAFNSDLPYARFVEDQIAADALRPEEPERLPALGFLAAGPWDESSLRDIREDTVDREVGRYLDRDDIVANVMSTFTSTTAHCARCHDHKFDPIPQRDYYALQAVFAGTEKAERLYDADPAIHRVRQRWMRIQTALDRQDLESLESLLTPALRAEQTAWEAELAGPSTAVPWTPVAMDAPVMTATTAVPVNLQGLPDGSIRVSGSNPPTNTYTLDLTLPTTVSQVSALRLEVLPDAALPARGPGRAANGNLHLTGLEILRRNNTGDWQRLPLGTPSADFNQEGWDIARSIDPDPATGWGIHPKEGEPHAAVFELAGPSADLPTSGASLRVVLRQDHGRQHTIGHFRISLTSAARPVRATGTPDSVLAVLRVPPHQRTPAQRLEVARQFLRGRPEQELARLPEPRRVFAGTAVFPANGGQKAVTRPRTVQVLRRGEIQRPIAEASPGALACLPDVPFHLERPPDRTEAGLDPCLTEDALRRAALARWLGHPDNPLVWRSIVNRVWQHHFGRGIVETPNDFGRMGSLPANPRLLDWLAVEFRDSLGGSLKRLHRLILTSAAWQRTAVPPGSTPLFQPQVRRLDAETFRDSVLRMSGNLDDRQGGPSDRQFAMAPGIHVTPKVDYAAFDPDGPGARRRSIYRFLFRTLPDPLMDTLDCPAGDQSAPVRGESFTALQAFALLHHPFVIRQSHHLAADAERSAPDIPGQVDHLCRLVWLRAPDLNERPALVAHARTHGLAHLCRLLLNSNELHFID